MSSDTPAAAAGSELRAETLRQILSLRGLDDDAIALIARTASIRSLASGEGLIRQGDPAETLYLVLTGRFRVVTEGATIATIGPGEPIGELAFFAGGRRTADVLAMRDGSVLELDRSRYDALVAAHPALTSTILATVSARLAALTARAAPLPPQAGRVVTLLGAGDGTLPQALVEGLAAAAHRHGGIALHDGRAAPVRAGPSALADWMRGLETAGGRHLLVIRDADASPVRAAFAAGSGDSLILAGALDRPVPPRPGSIEARAQAAEYRPVQQLLL